MNSPKMLYILIAVFCVFAIIAGIYAQFFDNKPENTIKTPEMESNNIEQQDMEAVKEEFNNLFMNNVNLNGRDTTGITRIVKDKEIVYSIDKKESNDIYDIDIHIPVVNINSQVASYLNNVTQTVFANKVKELSSKKEATVKETYKVDYVAYVNDEILSVAIKSTLQVGENQPRVMIQTYNYNLNTNTQVSLNDAITKKSLNKDEVNAKIKLAIDGQKSKETLENQNFSRGKEENTVENSGTFLLAENQKLYIIYAYGNQNLTSEMDVILFE